MRPPALGAHAKASPRGLAQRSVKPNSRTSGMRILGGDKANMAKQRKKQFSHRRLPFTHYRPFRPTGQASSRPSDTYQPTRYQHYIIALNYRQLTRYKHYIIALNYRQLTRYKHYIIALNYRQLTRYKHYIIALNYRQLTRYKHYIIALNYRQLTRYKHYIIALNYRQPTRYQHYIIARNYRQLTLTLLAHPQLSFNLGDFTCQHVIAWLIREPQ